LTHRCSKGECIKRWDSWQHVGLKPVSYGFKVCETLEQFSACIDPLLAQCWYGGADCRRV